MTLLKEKLCKIIVGEESLKLAPQNIISGSKRKISCLDNENLIDCKLDKKFRIGKIVSRLEFSIDDDPKIYKNEATTYAIPFSLVGIIISLLSIFKLTITMKLCRIRK